MLGVVAQVVPEPEVGCCIGDHDVIGYNWNEPEPAQVISCFANRYIDILVSILKAYYGDSYYWLKNNIGMFSIMYFKMQKMKLFCLFHLT